MATRKEGTEHAEGKAEPAKSDVHTEGGDEKGAAEANGNNNVIHTPSVSIKGALKGQRPEIPVADEEIGEDDVVTDAGDDAAVEVTEKALQQAWKEYALSVEKSHPRIFNTLNQQVPRMTRDGIIQITLNTNAQREYFIHSIKPELTRWFQQQLADIEYVFETNLVSNETTAKKVYTDQDKLDYLVSKNPDLDKLKQRFNLDFDQ